MNAHLKKLLIRWYNVSERPLPAWLARACDCDPALARERDAEAALTRRFRQDARPAQREVSPFFVARVSRAMQENPRARTSWFRRGAPGLVLAGAACLVALVLVRRTFPTGVRLQSADDPAQIAVSISQPSSSAVVTPSGLSGERGSGWVNPLDQEVEHVISDARGALHFLATSFLPAGTITGTGESG